MPGIPAVLSLSLALSLPTGYYLAATIRVFVTLGYTTGRARINSASETIRTRTPVGSMGSYCDIHGRVGERYIVEGN